MSQPCHDPIDAAKRALRAAVLLRMPAARSAADSAGERIAALAAELLATGARRIVSAFQSFGDEIDTAPLLARLAADSHDTCLPVVVKRGLPLVFRRWRPGDATASGPFGIRQPLPDAEALEPDLLFVPLVAFDAAGYRLGYGGGFYDRTLERLRGLKPVQAIGLAYDAQEVEAVPRGPHDQRLDLMLTPSGVRRFPQ